MDVSEIAWVYRRLAPMDPLPEPEILRCDFLSIFRSMFSLIFGGFFIGFPSKTEELWVTVERWTN